MRRSSRLAKKSSAAAAAAVTSKTNRSPAKPSKEKKRTPTVSSTMKRKRTSGTATGAQRKKSKVVVNLEESSEEEISSSEEERLVPLARLNSKTKQRMSRALSLRMYLANREKIDDLHSEFKMLGSTGNLYTIQIKQEPTCNCPDFRKGNHPCKHLMFIFCRVLKVGRDNPVVWQKALLRKELREIFANAPPAPAEVLANKKVRETLDIMEGRKKSNDTKVDESARREWQGEDCPICYEEMMEKKLVSWCQSCGNNFHVACWKRYVTSAGSSAKCPFCRSPATNVETGEPQTVSQVKKKEGFKNFSALSGQSSYRNYDYGWIRYN